MQNITRRRFVSRGLLWTGSALGALTLGPGLTRSRSARAATPDFPVSTCEGEAGQKYRILVAYASMSGTTAEVAAVMGRMLCDCGAGVDVRPVNKVDDPAPYQAVVIGSAIRSSEWLPEAKVFVETNREKLRQIPVAYFLTCLTLYNDPPPQVRRRVRSFLDPVLEAVPEVEPVAVGLFAGVLDYGRLPLAMRAVMRYKMWSKGVPEGDYRDWPAIRSWAKGLGPVFMTRSHYGSRQAAM